MRMEEATQLRPQTESPIKMDVPPREQDLSCLLLRPPDLTHSHCEITVDIQGAEPREEEMKLDNVCGSEETMLPDTQWVLFKCLLKKKKTNKGKNSSTHPYLEFLKLLIRAL